MSDLMKEVNKAGQLREPALVVGVGTTTVATVLSLITYFFPSIPDNVIQLLLVLVSLFLPLIVALFTRSRVWSPVSVLAVVEEALADAEKAKNTSIKRKPLS